MDWVVAQFIANEPGVAAHFDTLVVAVRYDLQQRSKKTFRQVLLSDTTAASVICRRRGLEYPFCTAKRPGWKCREQSMKQLELRELLYRALRFGLPTSPSKLCPPHTRNRNAYVQPSLSPNLFPLHDHDLLSGSFRIPSTSNRLRASSSAQVCILRIMSQLLSLQHRRPIQLPMLHSIILVQIPTALHVPNHLTEAEKGKLTTYPA